MNLRTVKRPWQRPKGQGARYNPDPFYHSPQWKRTKAAFLEAKTWIEPSKLYPDGIWVSNRLCIECYKKGTITSQHTTDHIIRIKDGGSKTDFSNLQSLCQHHHAIKSAKESQL